MPQLDRFLGVMLSNRADALVLMPGKTSSSTLRRLEWAAARCDESAAVLYGWADKAAYDTTARKLAQLSQIGMTNAISPAHTMVDGDLIIALSYGRKSANMIALGAAAAEAVGESIVRAVRSAPTMGGFRGLAAK